MRDARVFACGCCLCAVAAVPPVLPTLPSHSLGGLTLTRVSGVGGARDARQGRGGLAIKEAQGGAEKHATRENSSSHGAPLFFTPPLPDPTGTT